MLQMLMFPFEAESISYAVCKYFGIETGENSFGYIASWSQGKELKELRASLETINKTSGTLISDIERHYKEIVIKKGLSESQTLKTAIHETAHAKLHDREIMESLGVEKDRLTKEVEALYSAFQNVNHCKEC